VNLNAANGNHVLGVIGEYGAEMSCVRFVTESPDDIRSLLKAHAIHFWEEEVIVIRIRSFDHFDSILYCLKAG
jgi:hypothetical protein